MSGQFGCRRFDEMIDPFVFQLLVLTLLTFMAANQCGFIVETAKSPVVALLMMIVGTGLLGGYLAAVVFLVWEIGKQ